MKNQRLWNILSGVGCLLIALLAVLTIKEIKSIKYVGVSDQTQNTITVDGTGDALAAPDVATFSFGVTVTAPTVSDAQTQAATKANAAVAALKNGGVASNDITTESY